MFHVCLTWITSVPVHPLSRLAPYHLHLNTNPVAHILYFCHSSTQLQVLVSTLVSVLIAWGHHYTPPNPVIHSLNIHFSRSRCPLPAGKPPPLCGQAIWNTQALRTRRRGGRWGETHCPSSERHCHFRSRSVGHTDHRAPPSVQ